MAGDLKLIGVAGGSGSGKTLFSNLLMQRLPKATLLPLDQYYLDKPDGVTSDKHDYDVPTAFDFRLYRQHLDDFVEYLVEQQHAAQDATFRFEVLWRKPIESGGGCRDSHRPSLHEPPTGLASERVAVFR